MEIKPYGAYCSARDQPILVVRKTEVLGPPASRRESPDPSTGEPSDPSDVVCLSYGSKCTGAICPVFEVPTGEMAERLKELGLLPPDAP